MELTCSISKADIECGLIVIHSDERGAFVRELVLWHVASRGCTCRRYKPCIRGARVEGSSEADVAQLDDGEVRPMETLHTRTREERMYILTGHHSIVTPE